MNTTDHIPTTWKSRWRPWLTITIIAIMGWNTPAVFGVYSAFNTLYTTEFLLDYDPHESAWVLDRFGDTAGDLELRFGNVPSQSIRFDVLNNWFEFGSDVNLGQNQLRNAALDNQASAPPSPVTGQIYHNTTDQQTYLWDGTQWVNLSDAGHTQNTDTGTTSNTFTLDQDNSGGDTSIVFNQGTGSALKWDIVNTRFVVNENFRIEGNGGIVGQIFIADDHTTSESEGIINLGRLGNAWQTIRINAVSGLFETSRGLSVGGNIQMDGDVFTLDADNTGTGQNVSIVANQGTDNDGILRYNAVLKRWEISNDGAAYVAVAGPGPQGEQGPAGPQGPAGTNGYTTLFAQTAATTSECTNGGYVFTTGLDTNNNSVLDSGEVATSATICNGGGSGNGGNNGGGNNTLDGTCVLTRTASYSQSAQYSLALSGMVSYTDNNLGMVLVNGQHVSSISNSNGGSSSWSNPNYLLSILGSAQTFMLYVNYSGTPPAGQTPYVTSAQITKFGDTLNCSVVNN